MKNLKKLLVIANLSLIIQISVLSVVEGQNVGINEPNPDNSALLEMTSSERGLLVPRMTEAERDAIINPAEGLIIYNYDDTCLNIYAYNTWYNMCCCDVGPIYCETCGFVTTVVDVTNPVTSDTWMDRNLGAMQQATAYNDYCTYGALFQWGRLSDGHECITWTSSTTSDGAEQSHETSTLSSSDNPGHSNFILAPSSPYDWRTPQNNNLWQGVSGTNNPCPSGYRLPTEVELDAERLSWSSNNTAGAFASPLKLPVAGARYFSNGSLVSVGSYGFYWSSTVDGTWSRGLIFNSSDAYMGIFNRAHGFSVRCIKD